MQRIIGIDPGYERLGFAVIEGDTALAYGVITTPKGKIEERLKEIATDLRSLFAKYQPDLLVIEDLFFAKNVTTALKVAQARGVVMMLAADAGIAIVEVKPNEVKLGMTGYGRADKHQMQEMVRTIFCLQRIPQLDDAADALAIAWMGTQKVKFA